MTLWNASQVDLVAQSPSGEAVLFMVEERPWGKDPAQADQLLAKVNNYYRYVVGQQLASDYPSLAGRPVTVRLQCATEPNEEIQKVIDAATLGYQQHEIGFIVTVDPNIQVSD